MIETRQGFCRRVRNRYCNTSDGLDNCGHQNTPLRIFHLILLEPLDIYLTCFEPQRLGCKLPQPPRGPQKLRSNETSCV